MIDMEVERLRRLRRSALELRAVARALVNNEATRDEALITRGGCAAWRVARAVTGRLRGHPYASYQKDAGFGTWLKNRIVAAAVSLGIRNRTRGMNEFGRRLTLLLRELDDVRALTWAAELSDTFGRSLQEIRALIAAVHCETPDGAARTAERMRLPLPRGGHPVSDDWPFMTI
jgi:hypothetical protein